MSKKQINIKHNVWDKQLADFRRWIQAYKCDSGYFKDWDHLAIAVEAWMASRAAVLAKLTQHQRLILTMIEEGTLEDTLKANQAKKKN